MGSLFLLPCLLLVVVVVLTHQHRVEITSSKNASIGRSDGGLLPFLVRQAVEMSSLRAEVSSIKSELAALKKSSVTKTDLDAITKAGSTFVRWGRKSCSNGTTLVYDGFGAGKKHTEKGGGTNYLCLPRHPQFDDMNIPWYGASIFGIEYELPGPHYDHDMPCSVCRASQSTTIMIPATLTCPDGWTPQYNGHIVGQHSGHYATEYICLDYNPEHVNSGKVSRVEGFVYYVRFACGTLPCPPFKHGKAVACVVCSK